MWFCMYTGTRLKSPRYRLPSTHNVSRSVLQHDSRNGPRDEAMYAYDIARLTLAIYSIPSEARIADATKTIGQIDARSITVAIIKTQITLIHSCVIIEDDIMCMPFFCIAIQ